jgi:hypothetical protein
MKERTSMGLTIFANLKKDFIKEMEKYQPRELIRCFPNVMKFIAEKYLRKTLVQLLHCAMMLQLK